jgi:hypothetical protein
MTKLGSIIGQRFIEPGEALKQPLAVARDIGQLDRTNAAADRLAALLAFLLRGYPIRPAF